jgi:hypothetical protein
MDYQKKYLKYKSKYLSLLSPKLKLISLNVLDTDFFLKWVNGTLNNSKPFDWSNKMDLYFTREDLLSINKGNNYFIELSNLFKGEKEEEITEENKKAWKKLETDRYTNIINYIQKKDYDIGCFQEVNDNFLNLIQNLSSTYHIIRFEGLIIILKKIIGEIKLITTSEYHIPVNVDLNKCTKENIKMSCDTFKDKIYTCMSTPYGPKSLSYLVCEINLIKYNKIIYLTNVHWNFSMDEDIAFSCYQLRDKILKTTNTINMDKMVITGDMNRGDQLLQFQSQNKNPIQYNFQYCFYPPGNKVEDAHFERYFDNKNKYYPYEHVDDDFVLCGKDINIIPLTPINYFGSFTANDKEYYTIVNGTVYESKLRGYVRNQLTPLNKKNKNQLLSQFTLNSPLYLSVQEDIQKLFIKDSQIEPESVIDSIINKIIKRNYEIYFIEKSGISDHNILDCIISI